MNLKSALRTLYIILLMIMLPFCLSAQKEDRPLVQFSGIVMSADSMTGIPYVHIGIKGTHRTATAGIDGFFSFVAQKGDTLAFSSIGYYTSYYMIPHGNEDNKISAVQIMNKRDYKFNDIIVYPWGDKRNFKSAFIHTKIPKDLHEIAEENTNRELLTALGMSLPIDGGEATKRYIQIQAKKSYYNTPRPTIENLINPLAWAELVKSIKRGDFKKKKAPPLPSHDY